jgi:hypothetical protein
MPHDDAFAKRYRRWVVALVLLLAVGVAAVGARFAWQGRGLEAVLALLVLGWLALVLHGYRQEARERDGKDP